MAYVGAQTFTTLGVTTAQTITFTSLTGGLAAAPDVGDLVVVAWSVAGFGTADRALTIKTPGGTDYTLIGSEQFSNDSNTTNLRVAYRVMPDPVETQVVVSEASIGGTGLVTDSGTCHIFVLRGMNNASPLEQAAVQTTGANSRIVNPGSITPTTPGTVVYVVGACSCATGGTYTSSDLTDFRAITIGDSADSNMGAGYIEWTAGALNPATFGGGGTDTTSDSWCCTIVAFAPNPSGALAHILSGKFGSFLRGKLG